MNREREREEEREEGTMNREREERERERERGRERETSPLANASINIMNTVVCMYIKGQDRSHIHRKNINT